MRMSMKTQSLWMMILIIPTMLLMALKMRKYEKNRADMKKQIRIEKTLRILSVDCSSDARSEGSSSMSTLFTNTKKL
jgi:hypothetical protein